MNAAVGISSTAFEDYMNRVWEGLSGMETSERQDTIAEIRSHLNERIEQLRLQGSLHSVEEALAALGDPTELAHHMVSASLQRDESRSYLPWVLLRAARRIASTGAKGLLVFVIAVVGYSAALAFLAAGLLKPLVPELGFWVGSGGIIWGMKSPGATGHELLGEYFVYASIALSFVCGSVCTLVLQRLLRSPISVRPQALR